MCLKNKITAAVLCALVAGFGIFGIRGNNVKAQTNTGAATTAGMSIEQLQQLVNSLMQQIQQLIQQIAYLKPLETCGNGICRFGETAASCAADCGTTTITCYGEGQGMIGMASGTAKSCCAGFTAKPRTTCSGTLCSTQEGFICSKTNAGCGNGTCETGETAASCAADCGAINGCAPGTVSGCAVCNAVGSAWINTDSKCSSNQKCINGSCVTANTTCTANCTSKVCGADGCGGSCGTCATGTACNNSGQCTANSACSAVGQNCVIGVTTGCCDNLSCRIGTDRINGVCFNPGVCGNGTCEAGESKTSCGKDCGNLSGRCGNGTCNCDETATNCPSDCGDKECINIPNCGTGKIECTNSNCNIYCNNALQRSVKWGFAITTDGSCGSGDSYFCGVPMPN